MTIRLLPVLLLLLPQLPLQLLSPPLPPARHDYALFFAVNDYAPGSGFDDLGKPIENAEAIAKELHDRYGFETEVVKNPTLEQIGEKLRQYQTFFAKNTQGRYPANGQLLIYFTGHGFAENNNGYFVPADGRLDRLYSTASPTPSGGLSSTASNAGTFWWPSTPATRLPSIPTGTTKKWTPRTSTAPANSARATGSC